MVAEDAFNFKILSFKDICGISVSDAQRKLGHLSTALCVAFCKSPRTIFVGMKLHNFISDKCGPAAHCLTRA